MIGDSSCSGKVKYDQSLDVFLAICNKKDRFNKPIGPGFPIKKFFKDKKEAIEFVRRFVNSNGNLS